MSLKLDAARLAEVEIVEIPKDLGYSPGRTVTATPLTARPGSLVAGLILTPIGGIAVVLGGAWTAISAVADEPVVGYAKFAKTAGPIFLGVGTAALIPGIVFLLRTRKAGVDVELADPRASASHGVEFRISPGGARGTF